MRASIFVAMLAYSGVVKAHGGHRDWAKPPTPPGVVSHSITYDLDGKVIVSDVSWYAVWCFVNLDQFYVQAINDVLCLLLLSYLQLGIWRLHCFSSS